MNYVLYKNNFPPIIVKTEDKNNYRRALHDADSGNLESFINYIAEQFIWSLQLNIKAAKNESLEERQDWRKKLSLMRKNLDKQDGIQETKSTEVLIKLITERLYPLLNNLFQKLDIVRELFLNSYILVYEGNSRFRQTPITEETVKRYFKDELNTYMMFDSFKKNGINTFDVLIKIGFKFHSHYYEIIIENDELLNKFYHQDFSIQEIDSISDMCGKFLLSKIQSKINSFT